LGYKEKHRKNITERFAKLKKFEVQAMWTLKTFLITVYRQFCISEEPHLGGKEEDELE
jgi:hypothetical protein